MVSHDHGRARDLVSFLLLLLLVVLAQGELPSALLRSTRAVKLGSSVDLTCASQDGQIFDSLTVVYRHNGKIINSRLPGVVVIHRAGLVKEQTLKIFPVDAVHNGSYTCQPQGYKESNAAFIYVLTRNPVIDVLGSLKRVLYEDSSLYLTATVFYEANSVTLSVIHNESRHVFPSSQRNEIIFTNETILWKLPNVSRLYEGHFYVKGIGNLLSTDSTFQSVVVEVQIIRKPSVVISKKVVKGGYLELSWNLKPSDPDPDHQYDRVMYYRVEWKQFTKNVSEPNVVIDGLGACENFDVSVVAVGSGTESDRILTTIQTSLDPDRPIGFFRDPERKTVYASVRDKELPVCVYDGNSYLCHPDADIEIRRRQNADENYYLFNFNETESHRRKEPVPAQCPVVVSMCNESSHLCQAPSNTTNNASIGGSDKFIVIAIFGTTLSAFMITLATVIKRQLNELTKPDESKELIRAISSIISNEWKAVFRSMKPSLKNEEAFIEFISKHPPDQNKINKASWAASQCVQQWMKENPRKDCIAAVYNALVNGLQNNDLAEKFIRRFIKPDLLKKKRHKGLVGNYKYSKTPLLKLRKIQNEVQSKLGKENVECLTASDLEARESDLETSDSVKCRHFPPARVASSSVTATFCVDMESFSINSPSVNQVSSVSNLNLSNCARISSDAETSFELSLAAESNGRQMSMSSWSGDTFDESDEASTDVASVKSLLLENLRQRLQKESVSNQIGVEGGSLALPLSDVTDAAAVEPTFLEPLHLCVYKQSVTCLPKGTVSNHIGVEGGSLTLPSCGVLLMIPPGAITSTTLLGVRLSLFVSDKPVDVGGKTAYVGVIELLPHGAVFAKSVILRYRLRHHYKRGADRIENQYRLFYGEGKAVSFEEYDFMGSLESARNPVSYKGIMDVYLRDSCVELFSTTFCRYCTVAIIGSYYVWIGFFIYPIGVYHGKRKWNLKIVISCTCSENVDKIKVNLLDKKFCFVNEKRFCCPEPSLNSGQRLEFSLNEEDEFTSNFTLTSKKEFREDELRSVVEKDSEPPFYVERDVVVKCPEQISCNQPLIFNSNYYKYYERISSSPHKRLLSRDEVLVLLNTGSEASSDYRVSDSDVSEHSQERRSTDEVREASYATAPRKGERLCESTASILSTSGSSLPKNVDYNLKMAVAELAQAKWQRLLLCLGLDERVISQYKEQTYDNVVRACQIISDWKLREGIQASVSKLITACDKCGISKDEILKEYTERGLLGTRVETAV